MKVVILSGGYLVLWGGGDTLNTALVEWGLATHPPWCSVVNQSYTVYPVSKLRKKHKWTRTYMLEMNNVTSSGGT